MSVVPGAKEILDVMPDAVYLIDPASSRIVDCNRAAHEDLGMSREQVLNHSVLSLQKDVTGLPQWSEIAQVIRGSGDYTFVGRHAHADGSEVTVEVKTRCVRIDGHSWFLSVARDVTRRVLEQAEVSRRDNDSDARRVLYEVADGVWDWSVPEGSLHFSPRLKQMLGYGPDEMAPVLSTWADNVHPEDKPLVMRILEEHLAGKRARFEAVYRIRNRNGHYLWFHDRGRVVHWDESGAPLRVVGMVHDITDMKSLEQELQAHASRDGLTGLYNRRKGEELLQAAMERMAEEGRSLALCLIDIDHFKQVNDLYGHLVGDRVLEAIAEMVLDGVRERDIVYRWGGEELVVALPDIRREEAITRLETLREQIARTPVGGPGHPPIRITASFGLAMYPADANSMIDLLGLADSALYEAKRQGRNRLVGRPESRAA
ncbi:MAG: sensor domain-containing diguanylate cyclase [Halothiobacillaceae bacterium]